MRVGTVGSQALSNCNPLQLEKLPCAGCPAWQSQACLGIARWGSVFRLKGFGFRVQGSGFGALEGSCAG